jgi:tetratricopeptide (TPR) repeat protein
VSFDLNRLFFGFCNTPEYIVRLEGQMSQSENQITWKNLAELGGYSAAGVSWLLAISGRMPGNYPTTTSVVTIGITSLAVVIWRWRAMRSTRQSLVAHSNTQIRSKSSLENKMNGLLGRLRNQRRTRRIFLPFRWLAILILRISITLIRLISSAFDDLTDHLRSNSRNVYVLLLPRRWIDSIFIISVVLVSSYLVYSRLPAILDELKDPLLLCNPQKSDQPLRILVANILEPESSQPLYVEERLYDFLSEHQEEGQFEVCRWKEAISVQSEAKKVASSHQADMLIWGRRGVIYEIHLEVPAWDKLSKTISESSATDAASVSFQLAEPAHIGYVTEFAMSEMLFFRGKAVTAQERLERALNNARNDKLAATYSNDIAQGYFLLGLLYDPNVPGAQVDEDKAIEAYSQAITLNGDLFAAMLNRGVIRANRNEIRDAVADFSLLIERNTPLKCSAYINRASLQSDPQAEDLDLGAAIACSEGSKKAEGYFFRGSVRMGRQDYQGAIEDLKQAVALDPQGFYNYHLLGMAQLYAGQTNEARETYRQIVPTLKQDTRQQVLDELGHVAQDKPTIAPVIDEIMRDLKAARLPDSQ